MEASEILNYSAALQLSAEFLQASEENAQKFKRAYDGYIFDQFIPYFDPTEPQESAVVVNDLAPSEYDPGDLYVIDGILPPDYFVPQEDMYVQDGLVPNPVGVIRFAADEFTVVEYAIDDSRPISEDMATTMALGEEGDLKEVELTYNLGEEGDLRLVDDLKEVGLTYNLGEEGDLRLVDDLKEVGLTYDLGEEGDLRLVHDVETIDVTITTITLAEDDLTSTRAMGEEGDLLDISTMALGEESDLVSTMAMGEEGDMGSLMDNGDKKIDSLDINDIISSLDDLDNLVAQSTGSESIRVPNADAEFLVSGMVFDTGLIPLPVNINGENGTT